MGFEDNICLFGTHSEIVVAVLSAVVVEREKIATVCYVRGGGKLTRTRKSKRGSL
jgi:hypothetical protein